MTSLIAELRRRHVFKVAVAYAIVGWLLIEVAATILPIFEAPNWIVQVFAFFVILGFPLALVFSWAYDLTPEGLERTGSVADSADTPAPGGSIFNYVIIGLLVAAVSFMFVDNYVLDAPRPPFAGAEVDSSSLGPTLNEPPALGAVQPAPGIADETDRNVQPNSAAIVEEVNGDVVTQLEEIREIERIGELESAADIAVAL
jgi:hypothetical protein